ncbi:GNAT family N-acetyltransferase [Psychroserpens sp.]|uniref:GNAT family N-acetyltransferase n=1 Tax=Psychroserpens sp. TaxID=2020870 RepID=UPI00385ADD70
MKTLHKRLLIALKLLKQGTIKPVFIGVSKRIYSRTNFVGLEAIPLKLNVTDSKIDISIRPFESSDTNALNEEFRHARLVEEQIPNCYVATNKENSTIYRQWLFTLTSQQQVLDYFGPVFPKLNEKEAIIEGVFTHPDYRGLRIMSSAMAKIIQQPQYQKLSRVIAFVEEENKASLKGFCRIGFTPYMIRKENWFLFRRKIDFVEISEELKTVLLDSLS